MARNSTRSYRKDEGTAQRPIPDQPTPFVGLALAPLVALVLAWGVHFLIMGFSWDGRQVMSGSQTALGLAVILITLTAVGVATAAWHLSKHRHFPLRVMLTGSSYVITQLLALLVWVGPNRWVGVFFALLAWSVVGLWVLPRLHVLRRDPNEDTGKDDDNDLIKQLGLEGYRSRGEPEVRYDDKGEPERIVVDVRHRIGHTRNKLQASLPNIESLVGGPEGMSRVTKPSDGKSDHSILTVMLKDPLVGRVPNPGPSHPGGSVTDYAHVGMYDDGEPVHVFVCGGINPETGDKMPPTGYAFMGMTRSGKTVTENRLLLDGVITRRDGVILYLNKAKGGQDVQPIIAGVEAAVLSDSNRDYQVALDKVKNILTYRQKTLAEYGISAWSTAKCFDNPPQVTLDGRPKPMEPMPALIVHVGEADAILENAGEQAVYLASKGLSVGLIPGWSLQRWAATSMPTDLRFNIGTSFCFGVGDDYSAGFALSDHTIRAGAHPENWKNRKPGRFFVENIGIPEHRFPVAAKGIGDTDDDALYTNMRLTAEEWGPRMAKLDAGSRAATRGWWDRVARETSELRTSMTPTATPAAPAPVPDDPNPQEPPTVTSTFINDEPSGPDATHEQMLNDVQAEIADIDATLDGTPIYGDIIADDPDDPEFETAVRMTNPNADIVVSDIDVDITDTSKPEAATPEEAAEAFNQALMEMAADPALVDPDDVRYIRFRVHQFHERYPFRARSWFSTRLNMGAEGLVDTPEGHRLERFPDPRGEGWYRFNRHPDLGFR